MSWRPPAQHHLLLPQPFHYFAGLVVECGFYGRRMFDGVVIFYLSIHFDTVLRLLGGRVRDGHFFKLRRRRWCCRLLASGFACFVGLWRGGLVCCSIGVRTLIAAHGTADHCQQNKYAEPGQNLVFCKPAFLWRFRVHAILSLRVMIALS
jgi:hypothetical protein